MVPFLVTSDNEMKIPIVGYNVIEEFLSDKEQTENLLRSDQLAKSFKQSDSKNINALVNFVQSSREPDLCAVKTSKKDVLIPKGQAARISCRVNTGPVETKIPVLFEPNEFENWPTGLEIPETLL